MKVSKQCASHNSIETRLTTYKKSCFFFMWEDLLKCSQFKLLSFLKIITLFVIVSKHIQWTWWKIGCLLQRNTREFQCKSICISHISKPKKLSLGVITLKTFLKYAGLRQTVQKLDDLEKHWAKATSNSLCN